MDPITAFTNLVTELTKAEILKMSGADTHSQEKAMAEIREVINW